jgi:D-sedoheptulose 7-phosphate isomerase
MIIDERPIEHSVLDASLAMGSVVNYLDEFRSLLALLDSTEITRIVEMLAVAYRLRARVFVLGNGGSAATASHFACDLGKGVQGSDGGRFKVLALTDNVPLLTAWANDASYDRVFVEQLDNFLQTRDVVVGISASGNSPNVLRAMELARARGATTVGLTGFRGGHLKALCDICVVVPSDHVDQIEDAHLAVQHLVCRSLRELFAVARLNGAAGRTAPAELLRSVLV